METLAPENSQLALITKLLGKIEQQQEEIEALKTGLAEIKRVSLNSPPAASPALTGPGRGPMSTTRRKMLKKFAIGAVGATTFGLVTATVKPGVASAAGGVYSASSDYNAIEGQSSASDYN